MKIKALIFLCLAIVMVSLMGCGGEKEVPLSQLNTGKYVTLGTYKGLQVTEQKPEVTEDCRDNYINYILSENSTWEAVEREAKNGDTVNIDYVGKIDGVAFDRGSDTGYDLTLGSHTFIDGFEDGLIGAKKGEIRDVTATFPDPYLNDPDKSGVEAVFTVTVNEIKEKKTPELTDEFVKNLNPGCSTVEEYKQYVHDILYADAMQTYERNVESDLIEQITANCTFKEPPKYMVDEYYDRIVTNLTNIAVQNGMTFSELITGYYGMSMEEFEETAKNDATDSVKESIMLQAIANAEGITVSREEVEATKKADMEAGNFETEEALFAALGVDSYEDFCMCDKVMKFLKDNAVIIE